MSLSFPKKTEKNPHPHTNRVLRLRLRNKHAESVPADSKLRFFTVFVHLWKSRTQFQRMWETPLKQTKGLNAVIFRSETGGEHGRDDRIAFFYYPMSSEISDI